jgi:hypothetical protein
MDGETDNTEIRLLDLDALDAQARMEQSGEAYAQVSSGTDYRLGVVVTVSTDGELIHSIELLVCIFTGNSELRLPLMERGLLLTRELKERGYQLTHEDDGWVSCGKALLRGEVAAECGQLMHIIQVFKSDRLVIEKGTDR